MLRFKLDRHGKKKSPHYKVIVCEKTKDPMGRALEIVGHYNPIPNPSEITLNEERIKHWMSKGAQPTDTVYNIFISQGIIQGKKKNVSALGKKYNEKWKKEAEDKKKEAEKPKAEEKPAESVSAPAETAPDKEAPAVEEAKPEEKKESVSAPAEAKPDKETPVVEEKPAE